MMVNVGPKLLRSKFHLKELRSISAGVPFDENDDSPNAW